jgi:hypothetical protein
MKNGMENPKERFHIELNDGVVFITYLREIIDYEFVDDLINARLKLIGERTFPIYADFRMVKRGSREARERMSAKDAGIGVSAVAILINSQVHKTIYNFFHSIYKAPAPAKLFTNKEKALKWLEQFKDNSK